MYEQVSHSGCIPTQSVGTMSSGFGKLLLIISLGRDGVCTPSQTFHDG